MAYSLGASIGASAIAGGCLLLLLVVRFLLQTRRPANFPPGPPTKLGLGNLHQVPQDKPFLKFHEWSKQYGDLIGLKMGPKNFVIICNARLAREMFAKRGNKYAGRPYSAVPMEHVVQPPDKHLLFLPYDGFMKRWRSAVRNILSPEGVTRLGPLQSALGDRLTHDLMSRNKSWSSAIRRWGLETPMLSIAGQRLEDYGPGFEDRYMNVQHEWMYILEPSNTPPVEILPFLAYVPAFLADWKQRAARVRKGMYDVYFRTLEAAKRRHADGEDRFGTLFAHLLRQRERGDKVPFTDAQLAFMGGGLLDGAIDTTLSSFESLIVCLTAHKDVLRRAQAELDAACGDRMPNNEDVAKLPFLKACLYEVFRWRGAANVGLPHCTTEDDVIEGYHIPKDTTVLACAYAIHLHEDDFDQPEVFNPDRYLDNPYGVKYEVTEDEGRKETYTFSVGRRMCPGDDFAKMIILTTAAKLVWAFNFDTKDGKSPDLEWETGYRSGLTNPPKGFEPKLTPRSEERARAVEAAERTSEEYLSTWFG